MDRSEGISIALPDPGWEARLEQVFRSHYPRLISLLVRITGDRTTAEELASEAMYRLSTRPALLRPGGTVEAWLFRTATNLGFDALRVRARRSRYEQAAGMEALRSVRPADPLNDILSKERQDSVRSVLSDMRPRQAQALLLRHAGLSYAEAAGVLEVDPTAMPSILSRALAEFRKKYLEIHGSRS